MARNFTAASSQGLYCNEAVVSASYPLTVSAWIYPKTTANHGIVWIGDKDASNNYTYMSLGSDRKLYVISRNTTSVYTDSNVLVTTGAWTHVAGVWLSDSSRSSYVSGINKKTNTSASTPTNIDRVAIGYAAMSSPTEYSNLIIAGVTVWNEALSDSEIATIATGVAGTSIRTGAIAAYFPLVGYNNIERDYTGRYQLTAVAGGGGVSADDPPQLWKPSKRLYSFKAPAVAGTSKAVFAHHNAMMRVA